MVCVVNGDHNIIKRQRMTLAHRVIDPVSMADEKRTAMQFARALWS